MRKIVGCGFDLGVVYGMLDWKITSRINIRTGTVKHDPENQVTRLKLASFLTKRHTRDVQKQQ
jgi:hypothetical protein